MLDVSYLNAAAAIVHKSIFLYENPKCGICLHCEVRIEAATENCKCCIKCIIAMHLYRIGLLLTGLTVGGSRKILLAAAWRQIMQLFLLLWREHLQHQSCLLLITMYITGCIGHSGISYSMWDMF